jgi:alkylhydroperoxidase family enzyme
VLADYTTASISEKLRAMLGLLEKMTLQHESLGPDDVRAVMRAGVGKAAIAEALEVAFLFNIYDRLADAMGWDVPAEASGYYNLAARRLLKNGYL